MGRGSTFFVRIATGDLTEVRLIREPLEAIRSTPSRGVPVSVDLHERQILVVDDGDLNRRLIRVILERAGALVDAAENGVIAVEKVSQNQYDAVLMDMQMPVLDGYSATRQLRSEGHSLPIFALTANAMAGDREKCLEAGCSGYISKPVDMDALVSTLHDAFQSEVAEMQTAGV